MFLLGIPNKQNVPKKYILQTLSSQHMPSREHGLMDA
jgi:hypothetical protein